MQLAFKGLPHETVTLSGTTTGAGSGAGSGATYVHSSLVQTMSAS
jgi:hypothetical protein